MIHCGLYFTDVHIRQARRHRAREPQKSAWDFLLEQEQTGAPAAIQWGGLRYRFDGDEAAGERAALALMEAEPPAEAAAPLEAMRAALVQAQNFEMLRDHPASTPARRSRWMESFAEQVMAFDRAASSLSPLESLWSGTLHLAAGIVLEREDWFNQGVENCRRTIDEAVRPEGYLPQAVEGRDGGSLYRQILSTQALALSAEMAAHAGFDLWAYAARGVSVKTACAYLLYYYYYPEKWRWDDGMEAEAPRWFRQHAGFWEMLNHRAPLKNASLMLDELRPVYDPAGGGLTTLSHGSAARRGLFG